MPAGSALAYAPEAHRVVLARALRSLPRDAQAFFSAPDLARAQVTWDASAEQDPEADEALRRCRLRVVGEGAVTAPDTQDEGAILSFARAVEDLRSARATLDRAAMARAAVRLARLGADLADPYRVGGFTDTEPPGARAWFCDALDLRALDSVSVQAEPWAKDAPERLAIATAVMRDALEGAVRAGDAARVERLRVERLTSATSLVAAAIRDALRPRPSVPVPLALGFRLGPNPIRDAATVHCDLPEAANLRFECFDTAGRRVAVRDLGPMSAGRHELVLEASVLGALAPGIYHARLVAGPRVAEQRVVRTAH